MLVIDWYGPVVDHKRLTMESNSSSGDVESILDVEYGNSLAG
jgi:hypothetical protein